MTRSFNPATKLHNVQPWRHVPTLSGGVPAATAGGSFSTTTLLDCDHKPCITCGNGGQQATFSYDGSGNLVSRTDAAGRVTQYAYDTLDRLI